MTVSLTCLWQWNKHFIVLIFCRPEHSISQGAFFQTMTREELYEKAKLLPLSPGVYIMHAQSGKVIYVGKSKALKNRVSSYFMASAKHTPKTKRMVECVYDFEVYHTKTELEALILENQFIKQYMPRFNIKLKDSSDYPYIQFTDPPWSEIKLAYKRVDGGGRYFGPYSSAGTAYGIINTVKKTFRLPTCKLKFPEDIGRTRPCLNFHMGLCIAPCIEGKMTSAEFNEAVEPAVRFLKGEYGGLLRELEEKMNAAAEELEFEKAAKYRDTISDIKKIGDRQHIVSSPNTDADAIGIYSDDLGSAVSVLFVRGGIITDRECFFFPAEEILDSGTLTSLLFRFYTDREYIPKEVLLGYDLLPEDQSMLEAKFAESGSVRLYRPQRGDKHRLVEQSENNAKNLLMHKRETEDRTTKFLAGIASFLGLEVLPRRIEAYDISNSGDEHTTCVMTVMIDGRFVKKEYRTFNIRNQGQDDYAAMREAIERRLGHPEWDYPDLFLLDGGEGHVSTIKSLLDEKGVVIPVFGMVKDEHHKTRTLTDGENEISLMKRDDLFRFFYRIQEEVHNATFGKMDAKRRKSVKSTSLTDIEGVGPKTAELLLKHFGGLKKIKAASFEELVAVNGISRPTAKKIFDFYNSEDKE